MASAAPLTVAQKQFVKSTWEVPSKNLVNTGETVLLAFFQTHPEEMKYFDHFKGVDVASLKGTPRFRNHATKICRIIDRSVTLLNSANEHDELNEIWCDIGSSHKDRKIAKTVFPLMKEVMINVVKDANGGFEEGQEEAWHAFMDSNYEIVYSKYD